MTKLAGALLLIASTASAQTLVAVSAPPEKPAPRMVEAEVGMMLGGADAADVNGFSFGGTASVAYRIGENSLRAMFDYYSVGDGYQEVMQRHGRATRVGAALRHSFRSTDPDRSVYGDLWGELGGGYEQIGWTSGGVLARPDAELAFGLDLGFRNTRQGTITGTFMDFRTFLGEAPSTAGAMTTCGGPCTEATTPPRIDVSMFFEMGVHWGH